MVPSVFLVYLFMKAFIHLKGRDGEGGARPATGPLPATHEAAAGPGPGARTGGRGPSTSAVLCCFPSMSAWNGSGNGAAGLELMVLSSNPGAGIVVSWVKLPPPLMFAFHTSAGSHPGSSASHSAPARVPGGHGGCPSAWALAAHTRDLMKLSPAPCSQLGNEPAVERSASLFSLSSSPSLTLALKQINI